MYILDVIYGDFNRKCYAIFRVNIANNDHATVAIYICHCEYVAPRRIYRASPVLTVANSIANNITDATTTITKSCLAL